MRAVQPTIMSVTRTQAFWSVRNYPTFSRAGTSLPATRTRVHALWVHVKRCKPLLLTVFFSSLTKKWSVQHPCSPHHCRDWYISVGVSSISPTFSRIPFHSNILSNTSLTSLSPAVLVRRYSGTPERRSSQSSISELSVCPYLIIVHSTTSRSCRPSLPRAFHRLRRPHHCSSLGLLILDQSHVMATI